MAKTFAEDVSVTIEGKNERGESFFVRYRPVGPDKWVSDHKLFSEEEWTEAGEFDDKACMNGLAMVVLEERERNGLPTTGWY